MNNPFVARPSRFWWQLFPERRAQSGVSVRGPQPARGGFLLAAGEERVQLSWRVWLPVLHLLGVVSLR